MNTIPIEFQITSLLHQDTYLVNGELKKWTGETSEVYSTISSTQNYSPTLLGSIPTMGEVAADEVVKSAVTAYDKGQGIWPTMKVIDRIKCMENFVMQMKATRSEVVKYLMWEIGKSLGDSEKEFDRTVEYIYDTIEDYKQLDRNNARFTKSQGVNAMVRRGPLGVVLCLGPYNYPLNETFSLLIPAIIMGNTVIFKPAKHGVLLISPLLEAFRSSFPKGVINIVYGRGRDVASPIMKSGKIDILALIGNSKSAIALQDQHPNKNRLRLILGLEAKNPAIILPDADLELAADAAINAGFGSAGERCMAISAIVAVEPIASALVARIKSRMANIKTGDGTQGSDMGPLVSAGHRDKVASYIEAGAKAGATVVVDGRDLKVDGDGFFLGPTLLDNVTPEMSVYTDEIFGPVLSILRVNTYDEALALVNSHEYGNGTAIFTNDGGAARRFQNEVEVGMVGINVPIPVPMAYYSFGGWKNSLFGDSHAHGTEGVHFFTRGKVVTSRWLDPSHGGINLGFPQND
jgi:glyceraldehyde-3-phosphate dehydrogenase (NADP+)